MIGVGFLSDAGFGWSADCIESGVTLGDGICDGLGGIRKEDSVTGGGGLFDLFGAAGADDGCGEFRAAECPCDGEFGERPAESISDLFEGIDEGEVDFQLRGLEAWIA